MLMLKEVYGKEYPIERKWLEQTYRQAKGLTVKEQLDKILSEEDLGFTKEEYEAREKEQAESTAKQSVENGVDSKRTSIEFVNNSLELIRQRADHHVNVLNLMPFHHSTLPKEAITALLTELGWSSKSRRELGLYLAQTGNLKGRSDKAVAGNKSQTLDNYYGKERFLDNGNVYDGRYDACFVPKDFGKLKRLITKEAKRLKSLVDKGKKKQVNADRELVEFAREQFSAKDFSYEATVKANEALAKDFFIARFKAAKAEGTITVIENGKKIKRKLGLENLLVHNAMQSNHSTGITKAML